MGGYFSSSRASVALEVAEPSVDLEAISPRSIAKQEIIFDFPSIILNDPELARQVGENAGVLAVVRCGAIAKEYGRAMREALPLIYSSSMPNVYICGGASMYRGVLNSVHWFNIQDQSWQAMPPMPTARRLCAAASVGGSLYVFGGEVEEQTLIYSDNSWRQYAQLSTAERFNPYTNSWEVLPEMPSARAGCAAGVIGGLIYVIGGRIRDTVKGTVERFDTGVCRWERVCDLPTARSGCTAVALFGMLYVIGGKGSDGQILSSVERFDPSIGWWQMLPHVTMPRSASAAAAVGGKVYVAGGFNGVEGVRAVEAFDPAVGRWEEITPMISWRIGAAATCAHGKMYLLGGKTECNSSLLCESYDPASGAWSHLPAMPERHVYCAGASAVSFI